jgi:hypothetical protein
LAYRSPLCSLPIAAFAFAVLSCLAPFSAWAQDINQLTDSGESSCGSFAVASDSTGTIFAFESDCDLEGDNEDGNREIFFAEFDGRRVSMVQITESAACNNSNPTVAGDGSRIAFESDCDLDGSNSEANVEIFVSDGGAAARAVTDTFGCTNLAPALNGSGSKLVYDSDCGSVLDLSSEIFLATIAPPQADVIEQLTNDSSGDCDNLEPDINAAGTLVVFESDCDLLGTNEDFAPIVYSLVPGGDVEQLLFPIDDTCSNTEVRVAADGSGAVFTSDCDFVERNIDRGSEIFQVSLPDLDVSQITNNAGGNDCEVGMPAISGDALFVAFSSSCNLADANPDGNFEIFRSGISKASEPITSSTDCDNFAPILDEGGASVLFDSDCDLEGDNGDLGFEIYHSIGCRCGAPLSRGDLPLAGDAFFMLRVGVGLAECPLCECDVDGNGRVSASDALRGLQAAVGLPVTPLLCPDP